MRFHAKKKRDVRPGENTTYLGLYIYKKKHYILL